MELFKEMYRRMQLFPMPKGNAYIRADKELKKIVKRLKKKTTEEEFIKNAYYTHFRKRRTSPNKKFSKNLSETRIKREAPSLYSEWTRYNSIKMVNLTE